MDIGLLFWILMLIWLIFGLWPIVAGPQAPTWLPWSGTLLLFILLLIIGWKVFGAAIKT